MSSYLHVIQVLSKVGKSNWVPHSFSLISMEIVRWLPLATFVTLGIMGQWLDQLNHQDDGS